MTHPQAVLGHPATRSSYLALSHFTADSIAGLELVEPGVVNTALWRPDSTADLADRPERDQILAGVGRKH